MPIRIQLLGRCLFRKYLGCGIFAPDDGERVPEGADAFLETGAGHARFEVRCYTQLPVTEEAKVALAAWYNHVIAEAQGRAMLAAERLKVPVAVAIQAPALVKGRARELLLDNPHRVRVVTSPDTELTGRLALAAARRLADIKAGLDEDHRREVLQKTSALRARQLQNDDPGVSLKVGLKDVLAEMPILTGSDHPVIGAPKTWDGQGANGLVYTQAVVDLPTLGEELTDLLPWFRDCLTEVCCGGRDYLAAQAWQASVTGGISADASVRGTIADAGQIRGLFVLGGKALIRNHAALAEAFRGVRAGTFR